MVIPVGSLINAGAIVAGGATGMLLGNRLPEQMRSSVFQGLGLCTLVIGTQMTLKTANPLYMIGSILIGTVIGEMLNLEDRLIRGGEALKKSLGSGNKTFTEGFISASLLFSIGSMAILGPLYEGLTGDMTIILSKTLLDCFAAIAFGAAFGSGVMASALPVLLLQGSITLFAGGIEPYLTEDIRNEIEATGGAMILGIALNLTGAIKVRLANFLPALVVVVILLLLRDTFPFNSLKTLLP